MGGATQVISDLGSSLTNLATGETTTTGTSSGGGGGILGDISNAFTQITQPIEKAVTAGVEDTSKNLTTALQPVEKDVTQAVADTSKDLTSALQPVEKAVNYIGANPEAQLALALAVAAPFASVEIAGYLTTAGLSEAAAAATASAITSITVQVAQGVPIEKATENALVDVAVSGATSATQQQIGKVISSPGVTNAITSTVSSGLATAAKGGSQADVEKAMTAGLAGSTASTIYKEAVDSSSEVMSKAVGGAAAGAVKGGTEGAVLGGLSSAASALGQPEKKEPPPPVAPPLDQTAAEDARLARQETAAAGTDVPPAVEPKQGAYLPDSATAPTAPTDTTTATTKAPSKSDIFTSVYLTPKSRVGGSSSSEALSQALGTTTGLTASRGAGEIEGTGTGGQRKKVWNEESLKLKDALGV
jgi:hypothetical protein